MILHYISELLKPTDTFRRIRAIKEQNKKYRRALKYANIALEAVEIETLKMEPVTRNRYHRAYSHFKSNLK